MPSVASETPPTALKPTATPRRRVPAASDSAQFSPFESLLDSGSQTATPPDPSASSADKFATSSAKKTATPQAEASQPPAGHKATKGADAHGSDSKPSGSETATKTEKSSDDTKTVEINIDNKAKADTKPDANTETNTAFTTDSKADSKADSKTHSKTDANAAAGQVVTPVSADPALAVAVVSAPLPSLVTDPAQASVKTDAIAAASDLASIAASTAGATATAKSAGKQTDTAATATSKGKTAALLATSAEAYASTDTSKGTAQDTQALQDSGKPQQTGGTDKPATADAQGFAPALPHHAATPDAQAALTAGAPDAGAKAGANVNQPLAFSPLMHNATTAPATAAAPASATQALPQPAVPLADIGFTIAGRALAGSNRFDIRLDPPELGRIDVHLDVDKDGRVTSHLIADRKDTLNLLQRDASGLQRALQDAGLKTADNGLQFSLRDQSTPQQQNTASAPAAPLATEDETVTPIDMTPTTYAQLARLRGGLDIRV